MDMGGTESIIPIFQWIAALARVLVAFFTWRLTSKHALDHATVRTIFALYAGSYILLSFLLTGILVHPVEQYLYLLNVAAIVIVSGRMHAPFDMRDERTTSWMMTALGAVVAIALLTLVVLGFNTKMVETVGRF